MGTAWMFRNRRLFTVTDVTTGETPEYPELRAHVYFATPDEAATAVRAIMDELPSWRFVGSFDENRKVVAEVESSFGTFLSDVTVTLHSMGDRHLRAVIQSTSRPNCGKGDLGENAKFIAQLQTAMDARLVGG
jgi:uncharacterized protein (DUF1499 family)